jgi:hypothetical protein
MATSVELLEARITALEAAAEHKEAFGWPPGSVRALLALVAVVAFIVVAGKLSWFGDKDGLVALAGLASGATGFYFGTRLAEKPAAAPLADVRELITTIRNEPPTPPNPNVNRPAA